MPTHAARLLQVALPLPLPRLFDYLPPPGHGISEADIGRRVRVPFGRRELIGLIAGIGTADTGDERELRQADALLDADDPVLRGELLDSLRWLARYLHAPLGEVFATALPSTLRQETPCRTPASSCGSSPKPAAPRCRACGRAAGRGWPNCWPAALDEDALGDRLDGWRDAARSLAARGLVASRLESPSIKRSRPPPGPGAEPEQQAAIGAVTGADGFVPFLLEGVTGSGKTEVYLQAIAACLARGRQALVLVPEIGLTPQTLARFRERLGAGACAAFGLERQRRARLGGLRQRRGTRGRRHPLGGVHAAAEAGLIVIDEEHDGSYKQQDGIRYHARDFALVRAKALACRCCWAAPRRRWNRCTTPRPDATRTCACASARRGQATGVRIVDVRKRPLRRTGTGDAGRHRSTVRVAARCWCSRTAAATHPCCCATTAAGARIANAATRR
jgi:primosomal protein N' (replication factor Y)